MKVYWIQVTRGQSSNPGAGPLVDVLGHPAEAFPVALPFQHAAHEDL